MNIFWLINCHNPEHYRITCKYDVISYIHTYIFVLLSLNLYVVASVHCFSAEGLHFSALVHVVLNAVHLAHNCKCTMYALVGLPIVTVHKVTHYLTVIIIHTLYLHSL